MYEAVARLDFAPTSIVIAGLDPAIHTAARHAARQHEARA
jgi:hypothetical protein